MTGTHRAEPAPLRAWSRLPALVRASAAGVVVAFVGLLATEWLFAANDRVLPRVPWSPFAVAAFFVLYVQYLRGRGGPRATAEARRRAMAWRPLSGREWRVAAPAVLALFVFVPASVAFSFRWVDLPPDILDRSGEIEGMGLTVALSYLVALSLSAGLWEESAFRGYFQHILAHRHGHWPAILLGAILFTLAHFNHASGPARAAMLFSGAVMFGYLTHAARSILPAVVAHVSSDVSTGLISRGLIDSSWLLELVSVWETGVDAHLVTWGMVTLASVALFVVAVRRLDRVVRRSPDDESNGG